MIRKLFGTMVAVVTISAAAHTAGAQAFGVGRMDVGPTLGLGGIAGADFSFGGRLEKGIKTLPSLGDGILGVQASFDYASFDVLGFGGSWLFIGATANYHFKISNEKLDPFVGLGLGFSSYSYDCNGLGCGEDLGGIYFAGKAGLRYMFNEKMAFYGDVGTGAATLNVGVMFKLKGD